MFKYPVVYNGVEYGAEINYVNLKDGIHIEIFKKYSEEFIKVFDDYGYSNYDNSNENLYIDFIKSCIQRYEKHSL